jgi:hypothetical protein
MQKTATAVRYSCLHTFCSHAPMFQTTHAVAPSEILTHVFQRGALLRHSPDPALAHEQALRLSKPQAPTTTRRLPPKTRPLVKTSAKLGLWAKPVPHPHLRKAPLTFDSEFPILSFITTELPSRQNLHLGPSSARDRTLGHETRKCAQPAASRRNEKAPCQANGFVHPALEVSLARCTTMCRPRRVLSHSGRPAGPGERGGRRRIGRCGRASWRGLDKTR